MNDFSLVCCGRGFDSPRLHHFGFFAPEGGKNKVSFEDCKQSKVVLYYSVTNNGGFDGLFDNRICFRLNFIFNV